MRLGLLLGLALLSGCASERGQPEDRAPASGTILSANPCIDAILFEIADHQRIISISHYSQSEGSSSMDVALARRFPANGGTAEEIIALQPDVALLGAHTPPATLSAIQRAGIKVELISVPNSIAESKTQIDQIAAAIGQAAASAKLKQAIDAAVASANDRKLSNTPSLLIWQAGGLVPGSGTLIDDIITQAGFNNASSQYGLSMWDILPLEPVAANPPNIILTPRSAKSGQARNIALRDRYMLTFESDVMKADMPENLLHCGGPTIVKAMQLMRNVKVDYAKKVIG